MHGRIIATNNWEHLLQDSGYVATESLRTAKAAIDDAFGKDFAKSNPAVVASMIEAMSRNYATVSLAKVLDAHMSDFTDLIGALLSTAQDLALCVERKIREEHKIKTTNGDIKAMRERGEKIMSRNDRHGKSKPLTKDPR
jgi:hypothetical protein